MEPLKQQKGITKESSEKSMFILMLQSNLAGLFELQTLTVDESTIYM